MPSSPCAQVYNLLKAQVQSNMQQAANYRQQTQIMSSEMTSEDSQNSQFRVDQGKFEEHDRFKREIPYQVSYGGAEFGGNFIPYQSINVMQMLAGLQAQRLGTQQNAYKQTGFSQQARFNLQTGFNQQVGFNSPTGFSQQAGTNPQTGFNQQAGFNSQTGFNQQAGIDSQTGFNQQAGINSQTGFNQQAGINPQTEFIVQAGFNSPSGFGQQVGINSPTGFSQQAGFNLQTGFIQQAGFNQFGVPQYSQLSLNPYQYNANNQNSYWSGDGYQSGAGFQNPSGSVTGGLQMVNQNTYGSTYYPSASQFNQMGGYSKYPNYPESGYSTPLGRCMSAACGVIPVCAINCLSNVSPEAATQSRWMNYDKLKQRLAEYAVQQSGRSLSKPDAVTQASPVVHATPASSVAWRSATETTPRKEILTSSPVPDTPATPSSSQRGLGLQAQEVTAAEPANTQPPATSLAVLPSSSAVEFMSSATSEHPTQSTPLYQVTPPSLPLTYAPRSEEPPTVKPVRASRSILEE